MSDDPSLQDMRLDLEFATLRQVEDHPLASRTISVGDKKDCLDMITRSACVTATG